MRSRSYLNGKSKAIFMFLPFECCVEFFKTINRNILSKIHKLKVQFGLLLAMTGIDVHIFIPILHIHMLKSIIQQCLFSQSLPSLKSHMDDIKMKPLVMKYPRCPKGKKIYFIQKSRLSALHDISITILKYIKQQNS